MRVFVYRNLHKKCWSVKDLRTGRVFAHADRITLTECEFRVSEAGRRRVLREGRKNVHAGVVGRWNGIYGANSVGLRVSYNPYKMRKFQCGGLCPGGADVVRLTPKGAFARGLR
jgi:hypothetical protein